MPLFDFLTSFMAAKLSAQAAVILLILSLIGLEVVKARH